jgi:hypothetical protein
VPFVLAAEPAVPDAARVPRHLVLVAVALAAPALACLPAQESPPPADTTWFKGNLHTHTLWSDGNELPELVADWYKDEGYHFLALSDHNVLATTEKWLLVDTVIARGGRRSLSQSKARFGEAFVQTRTNDGGKLEVRLKRLDEIRAVLEEPGRFLLIPAEEITDVFDKAPIHINATNVGEVIPPQGGGSVREVLRNNLRAVREQAARLARPLLAHINHPNFRWALTAEDLAHVVEERFFEVFNGHPAVNQEGDAHHASLERLWDIANTLRLAELGAPPLLGLATDDSHTYHAPNPKDSLPGRGFVMVQASELTAPALIAALEAAQFYASSGVLLDAVASADNELRLQIRAEPGVAYHTRFVGTRRGFDTSRQPVVGNDGVEVRATHRYSPEIGVTFAEVAGPVPCYRLRGDELYVRAIVMSSKAHPRPSWAGQREQAWTQPVGWRVR